MPRGSFLLPGCVLVLGSSGVLGAHAASPEAEWGSLKGFASLVATRTSDSQVGWRVQNQPLDDAQGRAGQWSLKPESVVGLQADIKPRETWSATVQALAMTRSHGHLEPDIELAFARWRPAPEWQWRLGRIWTPAFLNSETRYIGFSNTLVRNTNYTLYQITNLDGGDVRYRIPVQGGQASFTSYFGRKGNYQLPDNAAGQSDYFKLPRIFGGVISWESEKWIARTSYTDIDLERRGDATASIETSTVPQLRDAATAGTCAVCATEADKWERVRTGSRYQIATAAARYTSEKWSLSGEYIRRTTNGTLPDIHAWDVEGNWFINAWTLYADYLHARSSSNNKPVFNQPAFASLDAQYAAGRIDRTIVTLGSKYQFSDFVSSRLEASRIHFNDPLAGVGFAPKQIGVTQLPSTYLLWSVTLDVVF